MLLAIMHQTLHQLVALSLPVPREKERTRRDGGSRKGRERGGAIESAEKRKRERGKGEEGL